MMKLKNNLPIMATAMISIFYMKIDLFLIFYYLLNK
jgi:hypothetical protein